MMMRRYIDLVESALRETANNYGIEGLPDDVKFTNRTLSNIINRGVFRAVATPVPGKKSNNAIDQDAIHYRITLHPKNPGNATTYQRGGSDYGQVYYHDPDLSYIETVDKGVEYLERNYARARADLLDEIDDLGDGIIYRGMSAEEYANFIRTGEIKSHGDYNIGDSQKGLTYWGTDAQIARSYANSFAPAEWKPTIGHPCYVVAAHMPDISDTRKVPGTGENEVGVVRPIRSDEIVAVWRGRVFAYDNDAYELSPVTHYDFMDRSVKDGDTHSVKHGGYSAQVVWERIR